MGTPIICITGPTAAGKSASVLHLAQHLPIEIINVDSATIYTGMDIGTAKPSLAEQTRVKHHLLDIRDPRESYSVAEFYHDTLALIPSIQAKGKIPILVGGTMMYYKALRDGLHDLPNADPHVRQRLAQEAKQLGWQAMHDTLQALDPDTAQRLAPNDSQRIQRALEIITLTGKPLSALFAQQKNLKNPYQFITLSLEPRQRTDLHHRIAERFHGMINNGLIDEVNALYQRHDLHPNLPSIRCVGYRQLWQYLAGDIDYPTAIEKGIAATRQLAKRQLTWLRGQPARITIDCFAKNTPTLVLQEVKKVL